MGQRDILAVAAEGIEGLFPLVAVALPLHSSGTTTAVVLIFPFRFLCRVKELVA